MPWKEERVLFILASGVMFIAGIYLFYNSQNNKDHIFINELILVDSLVINEKPVIEKRNLRSATLTITMKFEGYEKNFDVCTHNFKCVNKSEIMNYLHAGDTVSIQILAEDKEKLHRNTFSNNTNIIYSLKSNGKELIDLQCVNEYNRSGNKDVYIILFIIAPLTFLSGLRKNKQINLYLFDANPEIILLILGLVLFIIL